MHRHLMHGAVLRRADLDAREHVLRGDLLFRGLGDLGPDRRELLADLGALSPGRSG